jgi:hypothetical protein
MQQAVETVRSKRLTMNMACKQYKLPKTTSVAKGPKFRPHNPKGASKKAEGPEKLAAEFILDLHKKGRTFSRPLSHG